MERKPGPRAAITTAWILSRAARIQENPDWDAVVDGFETALEYSPHDPVLWSGLALAARQAGDSALEQEALQEALNANERRHLDPLVQFSETEQAAIEARLQELSNQPSE